MYYLLEMGRYCDLGTCESYIIENKLCYNKISYDYCFFIKFDKEYENALDKIEIDWRSDDILISLNKLICCPEGICADCFLRFKNLYITDISNNKIIPNEIYLNLLKTVVPDYIPNNITWYFHSNYVYSDKIEEYSTETVLNALHEYEKKVVSEEIDSNYEASELFRNVLRNNWFRNMKKTQLLECTKLHHDLINLMTLKMGVN